MQKTSSTTPIEGWRSMCMKLLSQSYIFENVQIKDQYLFNAPILEHWHQHSLYAHVILRQSRQQKNCVLRQDRSMCMKKDIIVSLVDNTIGRILYNFYEFYYDLLWLLHLSSNIDTWNDNLRDFQLLTIRGNSQSHSMAKVYVKLGVSIQHAHRH